MDDKYLEAIFGKPTAEKRRVFTVISFTLAIVLTTLAIALFWAGLWVAALIQALFAGYVIWTLIFQIRWRMRNGEW